MPPSSLLRHTRICGCCHNVGVCWGPLAACPSSHHLSVSLRMCSAVPDRGVWEFGNSCTMQAVFELFFQFASIQLRAQQEQGEKKLKRWWAACRLGWRRSTLPVSLGKKQTGPLTLNSFGSFTFGFYYGRGKPRPWSSTGRAGSFGEHTLSIIFRWGGLLERGTSGYGPKYFVVSFHGRVVVLPCAAVSTNPAFLQSSFPIGDFCLKYRTW